MFKRDKINYDSLSAPQQLAYLYQQFAARMADYGYHCTQTNKNRFAVGCMATHLSGATSKIQLTAGVTFTEKYKGKDTYIAFQQAGEFYVYPHDTLMQKFISDGFKITGTNSWEKHGSYFSPDIPDRMLKYLEKYKI